MRRYERREILSVWHWAGISINTSPLYILWILRTNRRTIGVNFASLYMQMSFHNKEELVLELFLFMPPASTVTVCQN